MTLERSVRYSMALGAAGMLAFALWIATAVIGVSWWILLALSGSAGWVALVVGALLIVAGGIGFTRGRREAHRRHEARMQQRLVRARMEERFTETRQPDLDLDRAA